MSLQENETTTATIMTSTVATTSTSVVATTSTNVLVTTSTDVVASTSESVASTAIVPTTTTTASAHDPTLSYAAFLDYRRHNPGPTHHNAWEAWRRNGGQDYWRASKGGGKDKTKKDHFDRGGRGEGGRGRGGNSRGRGRGGRGGRGGGRGGRGGGRGNWCGYISHHYHFH